jgi:hypothetical protein
MKKKIIYLLLALTTGCGEALMTYDVTTGTPIVESYLQAGSNLLTVKVYSMEIYLKDDYELSWPVEGLQLKINDYELTETATKGTYSINLGEDSIRSLQDYNLSFEYGGKTISASTSVPKPISNLNIEPEYITRDSSFFYSWDTSDTTEIKLTWDDPDNSYYQVYIESPAATPSFGGGGGEVFRRRMMQPSRGNSYTAGSRDFTTVGDYLIYVYRVNRDYADLYERTGSTDLANPASAVENAFGIFTAMSVAKIKFQVIEAD